MPEGYYEDLLKIISEEKFLLSSLLGKYSPNREDAARNLIKIFDHQDRAKEFLFGVIEQEVAVTSFILLDFLPSSAFFDYCHLRACFFIYFFLSHL